MEALVLVSESWVGCGGCYRQRLPMVRTSISAATGWVATALLRARMPKCVLDRAAVLGERAIRVGILTVADIRNGEPEACTLPLAANSPGELDEARQHPTVPVAPRALSSDAPQQKLEQAMARAIAMRRRH